MHLFPFYSLKSCLTRLCFSPLRIELRRSKPEDLETFQSILKAPIVFNAPKDMIVFDTATIEQPLEGANCLSPKNMMKLLIVIWRGSIKKIYWHE